MTIDGNSWGSILSAGSNGVNINGAGITVYLRNLSINGFNTGIIGVNIVQAAEVHIENSAIMNFKDGTHGRGIVEQRATAGSLFVTNTTINDNRADALILNSGTARAFINGLHATGNGGGGVTAQGGAQISISDSILAGNAFGIFALSNNTLVNVDRTQISGNATGILALTGSPTVRVSDSQIIDNNQEINISAGSTVATFTNNQVSGNGGLEAFNASIPLR
jgi:hypothetical protein